MKSQKQFTNIASILVIALTSTPAISANENPFAVQEYQPSSTSEKKIAHGRCGMCGGSWEGRCGGMMNGMMMGGAMSQGIDRAQLPGPNTTGAKLVTKYCSQCHSLPSPKQHSAAGWPTTVTRMNTRMQWMKNNNSPMNIIAPTETEIATLTAYLQKHAAEAEDMMPSAKQDKQ
jgi:uncharacterized low-complexity protein